MIDSVLQGSPSSFDVVATTGPQVVAYDGDSLSADEYCTLEALAAQGLLHLAESCQLPESNLLPVDYQRKQKRRTLLINSIGALVLSLASLVLLWLCLAAANWRIQWAYEPIESEIAPIQHIARSVESKRQQVTAVQQQLSSRGQIMQILTDLYEHTPKEVSLSRLVFVTKPTGATVEIKGQADTLSNAFDYAEVMRKATLLNELQIENAQQVPRPGGSIVEFKAFCVIKDN